MKDFLENLQDSAERRMDEMTEGLAEGFFRCGCGRVAKLEHAQPSSSNPYCTPICCICFAEMITQ